MRARDVVGFAGAAGVAAVLAAAFTKMPAAGGAVHPYRDLVLPAALRAGTPNLVSSVNFDLRALDTLGEETIVAAAVVGVLALLQPPRRKVPDPPGQVMPAVRFAGWLLLPVAALLGLDVIVHGHLTPGGGFQGGVVLATGWHLLYLSGSYPALLKLRPLGSLEYAEAAATAAYVLVGLAGLFVTGSFLANVLPLGSFGSLLSAGTVPVLSVIVGVEVAAGVVVLLSRFLAHALGHADEESR
ncbi:MnhB domain-containing protein [Amycolatopsis sp. FDAARGOS 1241]|uniref:MnhB domain-containing protein n=1 Tax=Amycolatopsis sp. FDAARGOS 1241 TaxID=2778070 RepID=UPI00194FB428|nr:MnhB domain-containing protein [Amycolatopsis sp. FDAARGOS 1241]QRP49555.1 sodium:proton antiporter [Amycolatopsis sp. FDAARGOS 1241]